MSPRSEISALVGLVAVVFGARALVRSRQLAWAAEDGSVETVTAGLLLIVVVLAVVALLTQARAFPALLAVMAGVAFLDEVSFGRVFVELPELHAGSTRVDAVHDLLRVGFRPSSGILFGLVVPILLVASVVVAVVMARRSGWWGQITSVRGTPAAALTAAVVLGALAQVLDLLGHDGWSLGTEEVLELVAAGLLVLAASSWRRTTVNEQPVLVNLNGERSAGLGAGQAAERGQGRRGVTAGR